MLLNNVNSFFAITQIRYMKVHNLVLVLQISRCFLGQQNLQDLGLVLNLLKKRLILFASV